MHRPGKADRPRGLRVVIVGPDGSGKSTIADGLIQRAGPIFTTVTHQHWRPGVLPRLGRILGRSAPTDKSVAERTPFSTGASAALLIYYWLDFLIGEWIVTSRRVRAGGLVVVERGWLDLAVAPGRYRLREFPRSVRALGKILPRVDVYAVLEATPREIFERKGELGEPEIKRQIRGWASLDIPAHRVLHLDTRAVVREKSLELLLTTMEELPRRGNSRGSR